jgi:chromosome segregation ATPase
MQVVAAQNQDLQAQLAESAERIGALEADLEAAQLEVEAAQASAEQAQEDYEQLRTKLDVFASQKWEVERRMKEVGGAAY